MLVLLRQPPCPQLRCILRSYSSWASAIRNASSPMEALRLYCQMQRLSVPFDSFSILFTLRSCSSFSTHNSDKLTLVRHLHAHILKMGFHTHLYVANSLIHNYALTSFDDARRLFDETPDINVVTWNTMITGYSNSGNVERARSVFEEMPERDVKSWSALIAGYMINGDWDRGLSLLPEMLLAGELKPDQANIGLILSGCAHLGYLGLQEGKSIHGFVVKNGWVLNVELGTALVDMYAKCGFLRNACLVFELMKERNVLSWTALVCASAQHDYGREAISIFNRMRELAVRPNEMTFTGVLSACARSGLIEEGRKYFNMIAGYGMEPRIQHYGCMVDMFGRAGRLQEAYEVIKTMRLEPDAVVWSSFLFACKVHKQFGMAEKVIGRVLTMLKPENNGGVYALISDLFASSGRWNDAAKVRKLMVHQNVRKVRGCSSVGRGKK